MEIMQWQRAPTENLKTWKLVVRIMAVSVVSIAVVLLAMAAFLT